MGRKRKRLSKKARRRQRNRRAALFAAVIALAVAAALIWRNCGPGGEGGSRNLPEARGEFLEEDREDGRPAIDVQLLTPNPYSRPQEALNEINGIVIHYTANPGTTAQENHDYFEGLKDSGETYASSHFVVGLDGEIIQCIPSSEISYASNDRNYDTISVECCHPDESGQFTEDTYQSMVELTAWLCKHFQVPVDSVIRHYDVTGKECPKYFVDHPEAWEQFRNDVGERLSELAGV